MISLDGHSAETARLVAASVNGDPTATAAAQAAHDAYAAGTTSYLAELQAQAELWLAEQTRQQQLARLPVDDRPAAATWLAIHGVLPPWYQDRLTPEAGS